MDVDTRKHKHKIHFQLEPTVYVLSCDNIFDTEIWMLQMEVTGPN
jgi:hypothetical protein